MRLRFLEMVGARCACTVGLSSGAELGGDGVVAEVVGHEVARGYRPTAMLRDGGRGGTSTACASLRGSDTLLGVRSAARGRCLARRRAPRRRCRPQQGERVFKQRCVRARGSSLLWTDTNEYCAVHARINSPADGHWLQLPQMAELASVDTLGPAQHYTRTCASRVPFERS